VVQQREPGRNSECRKGCVAHHGAGGQVGHGDPNLKEGLQIGATKVTMSSHDFRYSDRGETG
jgi:hypothetical protein